MISQFMPAPFGGIKENVPIVAVKNPYCERLRNFNLTPAGAVLRNGNSVFDTVTTSDSYNNSAGLFAYGNTKLFQLLFNIITSKVEIWDVEASTVANTSASTTTWQADTYATLFFNDYLYVFSYPTFSPGWMYSGSAWAVIGWTGATTFNPFGGNVYNRRAYLIQYGEPAYWYTPIDAVATGLCTKVNLGSFVERKCTLSAIASVTLADTVAATTLQAFIFSNGEVLFYSGSFPGGSDWSLVGKARVGQMVAYSGGMQYQGDYLIFCDSGIVSLRDLFLKGSQKALTLSVNANIQKTWGGMISLIRSVQSNPTGPLFGIGYNGNIRGVYDQKNNRIIVMLPYYYNADAGTLVAGNVFFVFNCLLESWSIHDGSAITDLQNAYLDMTLYKNKVLAQAQGVLTVFPTIEKEGSSGFTDAGYNGASATYDFELRSAAIPYKKDAVYNITGIEPIIQSDLYAQSNYNLIADFGRQTTDNQKTDAPTTSVQKPMANVGVQANFAQLKLSGTTTTGKSIGLSLYGYNVWFDAGQEGSR